MFTISYLNKTEHNAKQCKEHTPLSINQFLLLIFIYRMHLKNNDR